MLCLSGFEPMIFSLGAPEFPLRGHVFFCRQLHDLLLTELSVDLSLVVVVDNLFSVIHATVADLDGIAVEDFYV